MAGFLLEWVKGFNHGEWDQASGDLAKLIGRKPTTTAEYFKTLYDNGAWR